ncbi:MAG TPA: GAF domain-containing protein, partial [Anaerolineaceae bacterium]|nr:GAF domain-containing protein [Anaerolineaceae bacterium]
MITKQHYEALLVLLIGISTFVAFWFGVNVLIIRRVKKLIELSKRLSSGDLTARSDLKDYSYLLGGLAQAFNQMAASLEIQTVQLQQRTEEFAALNEMANELATLQDLSIILERIVSRAMALLGVPHVTITLYDPVRDDLVITMVKGFQLPVGTRIPMGEGATGLAAQTRQPVTVGDYHAWENHLSEFEVFPFSSMMQVPMVYQGELIGVLGVAEIEPGTRKFNQMDVTLLSLFAEQAASAIKNGRLFEESRSHLQELKAMNEISTALSDSQNVNDMLSILLNQSIAIFNAIAGSIWLFSSERSSVRPVISRGIPDFEMDFQPGKGIASQIFSWGKPYLSVDLKEDLLIPPAARPHILAGMSGAFIPIQTAQAKVGILFIGFQTLQQMTDDRLRLVTIISEMASNTIHRIQLYEQTKSQLQRLSALHTIDLAITNSPDIGNTLQVLLDQVITQLGVDAACILVVNSFEQTLEFAASRGFSTDALRNTRLRLGDGYAGKAALEQQTIYIPDLKTGHTDFLRSPSFAAESFVTYYAVPLVAKGQVKGVLEVFHRSPLENNQEWLVFLEALASQAAIAIDNATLFTDIQRSNTELNLAYNSTLEGWSRALDLRDRETEGHSQRVTELALQLARNMSVSEPNLVHIWQGALLHDIGKLGIPDNILLKPGLLSKEEREIIEKHPTIAFELLSPIAYLRSALDIPYCHHEKWDGSGYPRGLKGEQIPQGARIFAVVDVWDALLSDRPYRKRWSEEKARAYLLEQ